MIPIRYSAEEFNSLSQKGYFGTTVDYLDENAKKYPDKEALVDSNSRVTYASAKAYADALANSFLELGLRKDQRIVIQIPNVVEYLIIRSALKKSGLIGMYTMMYLRHKEIEFACKETEATGIVIMPEFNKFNYLKMVQEIKPNLPGLKFIFSVGNYVPEGTISITGMMNCHPEKKYDVHYFEQTMIKPGEVAEIKMTSGTTGLPKLTESINTGKKSNPGDTRELVRRYQITGDDVFAALAPLTGGASGGAICKGIALDMGCKIVMLEKFDAEKALELIERERVTFATGVPTMMATMVRHKSLRSFPLKTLRVFHSSGAYLAPSLAKEVEENMGCKVVNHYGSIDIGFATSTSVSDPLDVRINSIGKPLQGIKLKIVDGNGQEVPPGEIGEILWSAKRKGISYYRDIESTLKRETDGLIRTGDLGRQDKDGNVYIVGRKKDVIIRGGQNIYPAEIESILITHPKILNVAVVSMPDPLMGEKACAFVITREGQNFSFEEMIAFMSEKKCAQYKYPERLELVKNFPMSGDGQKVMKMVLSSSLTKS